MRPGQGPLMPTLAPPLGLGPAHPALLQPPHNLGHGGLLHHPQPGEPRPQLLDTGSMHLDTNNGAK